MTFGNSAVADCPHVTTPFSLHPMTDHLSFARVIARMHHDPKFCRAVFDGPRPRELSKEQHREIRKLDPRAFLCDPQRPLRLIQSLLEEAPVSSALAGLEHIQGFCQSEHFHRAVMQREYMICAYLSWLAPLAQDLAKLERAIALARRPAPAPTQAQSLCLSPGCRVVTVQTGTLERYEQARQLLGPEPLNWLATHERLQAKDLSAAQPGQESLILANKSISRCNEAMAELLSAMHSPRSRTELWEQFGKGDISQSDFSEVIDDLIEDGLVQANPD